eukprot:scaffold53166_cov52-Attheya_sp.AAC.1
MNRLIKEAAFYMTELKENEDKLDKMKQEKHDVYDIKYFDDVVVGESRMMAPDSQAQMKKNIEDLEIFLDSNRSSFNAGRVDDSSFISIVQAAGYEI